MITVKFTPEQYHDLKVFLSRVDLKGCEAPALMSILRSIEEGSVVTDGKQVLQSERGK